MAEKRVIELDIQTNEKSLKAQLKEAQAEVQKLADKFGATSQEAVNAAKKAAQLKDSIGDAASLTDSFNPDAKFNALSKSIGGVLDGFQAFEGALGLVGVEGEAVQETMLKVQSAMALSQGIQGVFEARDSFKQLGAVIKDAAVKLGILTVVKEADTVATAENVIATEAQVVANQQAAVSFKTTGVVAKTSLNGIKGAIAATGIGLLVIALGAIVVYWDDIKAAVSGVSSEQAKLNQLADTNFETSKEQLSNLDAQDNVLKLQGKSEREILNLKIEQVNNTIKDGQFKLKNILITSKAEEAAAIQNYNMTKKVVDFILDTALFLPKLMLLPIDMAIKGANKVSEALGFGKLIAFDMGKTMEDMQDKLTGFVAGSIFNVPELKKENKLAAEEIEKSILDLTNQQAGFKLSIKEIDKAAAQTAIDANKEKNDLINNADAEAARLEIEQQNELNKRLEDLAEQNFQNTLTEQEREILLVNDKYFELETLADGNKEALAQIELAKANELNDINLKYQGIAYENDKVAKEKKAVLDKEAAAKEIENAKAVAEQKAALQQQGLDTALQGVQLIKNVFENQKGVQKAAVIAESAIGIAKMIIANKLANAGALATPQAIATSGAAAIPVIALNNISTGIGIAANIAATAKALKTLGGGSAPTAPASGGGGGSAGGGAIAPNFNVIGSSGVNQLAQIQQQPTRAYVVSGDVATGLSLERNRLQNASF
jgi:hypothetical protein